MPDPTGPESLLVLGGGGAVGRLFERSLSDPYDVRSLDLEKAPGVDLCVDACGAEAMEAVREADVVLLCLPEAVAIGALDAYADVLEPAQLLVDTLSVKSEYLKRVAALGLACEVLSLNPMFAPDLGFEGRSIASIGVRAGPRTGSFRARVEACGATFVEVEAEEHDRLTAALQAAGHAAVIAFGRALRVSGYDAERMQPLWTPPHRALLALLARMGTLDPEVYRDIQRGNPAASSARAAIREGLEELESSVDDPAAFARVMEEAIAPLGARRAELESLAARLLRTP